MNFQDAEQRQKMVLLGGLYISQFLGLAFIITAVPAIMRENGAGLDEIGWIYALGLIWAIKFIWAPLVDRYGSKLYGHYRSWLIVLQCLIMFSLIGAAFFDVNSQLSILAVFFAMISLFSATQDIAADALAVTVLKPEERGLGNSIQVAGGFIGNILGGGIVLIAYAWLGWTASLLILAAGVSIPLFNILRHQEQPAPADARVEKVSFKDIGRFFKRPRIGRWVAILTTYGLAISISYAMINPMLVDLGWTLDRIGFATNIIGSLFAILGAVIAGTLVQRLGRKSAMLLTGGLAAISIVGLYVPAQGINNTPLIYASLSLMLVAYGASTTILATLTMDKSDPEVAGTDYSLQYSLFSLLAFLFSGLSLGVAESVGYVSVLTGAIMIGLISLVFVWFYEDFTPMVNELTTETQPNDGPALAGG